MPGTMEHPTSVFFLNLEQVKPVTRPFCSLRFSLTIEGQWQFQRGELESSLEQGNFTETGDGLGDLINLFPGSSDNTGLFSKAL